MELALVHCIYLKPSVALEIYYMYSLYLLSDLALYVTHNETLTTSGGKVPFHDVRVNLGGHFDSSNYSLTIPERGQYLVR